MEGHEGTYTEDNNGGGRESSSRPTWKLCWGNGSNRSRRGGRSLAKFVHTRTRSKWKWGKTKDRDVGRSKSTENVPKNKDFPESSQSAIKSSINFEPGFNKIVDECIESADPSPIFPEEFCNLEDFNTLGDKYSLEGYVKFLEPFIVGIPKKLSNKHITFSSEIYKNPDITDLEEHLMNLPTKGNNRLDMALEMAYGAYILHKLTHGNEILKAGKNAHKAAVLFFQAEILRKVGNKLLEECQHELCQVKRNSTKK